MLSALLFPIIAPHNVCATEMPAKHMDRAQLLSLFKKGERVDGFIVDGQDLIEIIKTTNYPIRITNVIIKDGLDFRHLPFTFLEPEQLPKHWRESEKAELTGPTSAKKIYLIDNQIEITHSQIAKVEMEISTPLVFLKPVIFSGSTFNGKTRFHGAIFDETASFNRVAFDQKAVFDSATFRAAADFNQSQFTGETFFNEVVFHKEADFSFSVFTDLADFKAAVFHHSLSLASANFLKYTDFRDAVIGQLDFDSTRRPIVISGRLNFRRAIISDAHFQDIFFENNIDFSDAIFIRVLFKDVSFEQDVYFLRTKFRLQTALYDTRFKQAADFTDAALQSNQAFLISYVRFNKLLINWQQLPPLNVWQNNAEKKVQSFLDIERAGKKTDKKKETRVKIGSIEKLSEVVAGLEAILRAHRQLKDANQAYYELKTFELVEARKGETVWQWFSAQPFWIIWWATTGFGMQLGWILLWCLGFNLLFTVVYFSRGRLSPSPEADDAFRLRILDFPKRYYTRIVDPLEASVEAPDYSVTRFFNLFWFSAVILLKTGYRSQVIDGRIAGLYFKWVVRLEWVLGLYLLAALSYTLQNVVPVVNKLVTGVF